MFLYSYIFLNYFWSYALNNFNLFLGIILIELPLLGFLKIPRLVQNFTIQDRDQRALFAVVERVEDEGDEYPLERIRTD